MAPVKPTMKARSGLARKSATAKPARKKPTGKLPVKMSRQVKTKPGSQSNGITKKKKPEYTEKQLGLPVLNSIVPANAKTQHKAGGTGKKKNKIYVDDKESMMTILAMVTAEKEGQIESKIARERQLEGIREARRKEAEAVERKKDKQIEDAKAEIKHERQERRKAATNTEASGKKRGEKQSDGVGQKPRKKVSFA